MATAIIEGYDANFVEEVADYLKCIICQLVLRNPVLIVECGHRLCSGCFERLKKRASDRNEEIVCPHDRIEVDTQQVVVDKGIERVVLDLKIKCSNDENGCTWIGELRDLQNTTHPLHQLLQRMDEKDQQVVKLTEDLQRCVDRLDEKDRQMEEKDRQMEERDRQIEAMKRELECVREELRSKKGNDMTPYKSNTSANDDGTKKRNSQSNDNQKNHNTVNIGSLDQKIVQGYEKAKDKFEHVCNMLERGNDDDVITLLSHRGEEMCTLRGDDDATLHMEAAGCGRSEVLRAMETYTSCDVLHVDWNDMNALHYAVHDDHMDVVRHLACTHPQLLSRREVNGITPYTWALVNDHHNSIQTLRDIAATMGINPDIRWI